MKLNLLPATVSKGRQSKTAWIASIVIILVGIGISLGLIMSSAAALNEARKAYLDSIKPAQDAYNTSKQADAYMALPEVSALMKNVALSQAMIAHNDKYPDLYNSFRRYIPPFYRLTSISATPISEEQSSVTLTGTLDSYQQYADLMLALMLNPEAISVARSGYQADEAFVPQITELDQFGRPRRPGEAPIPDDPLQRLAFFEAQGAQTAGFTGEGGFGSGNINTKQAMPGESLVTVQMILNHGLQVPNPTATLGSGAGGGATTGGAPGIPGGIPGGRGPGGPPAGIPGGAPGPGGRGPEAG